MQPQHLLIIRFSALGDVAMMVPVIFSLAHQYPNLRITVCSRPRVRFLFEGLAPNVGFMAADVKGEYRGLPGLNKLYSRLLAKQPTAIADFHDVLRSKYLRLRFVIGGYKCKHINKHHDGKRKLCAYNNKVLVQQPTSFQNYADVLERLGYPVKLNFTSLFSEQGGDMTLLPKLFGNKPQGQQWIGIAPFAAHECKQYPAERMMQVIKLLAQKHKNARIFLFGGGDKETKLIDQWAAQYPQCTNVPKNLASLSQELILMSHLDVMVSMDSANMHLASLTHTPVVSIWGATHPYAGFMGWNQSPDDAIGLQLDCRPCSVYGNKPCRRGDLACLYNITPEQITDRVEKHLKEQTETH